MVSLPKIKNKYRHVPRTAIQAQNDLTVYTKYNAILFCQKLFLDEIMFKMTVIGMCCKKMKNEN